MGDPRQWSKSEVTSWLQQLGFSQFIPQFSAQEIDGQALATFASRDFLPLAIKSLETRTRILQLFRAELQKPREDLQVTESPSFVRPVDSKSVGSTQPLSTCRTELNPQLLKSLSGARLSHDVDPFRSTSEGTRPRTSADHRPRKSSSELQLSAFVSTRLQVVKLMELCNEKRTFQENVSGRQERIYIVGATQERQLAAEEVMLGRKGGNSWEPHRGRCRENSG